MPYFEWNNDFSLGIEEIDKQHHELINLINELHDAMKVGQGNAVVKDIIAKLEKYTIEHFGTEEKYFDQFKYSGTQQHKNEHHKFTEEVADFRQKFENGQVLLSLKLINFLKDWLVSHIQGSDKKYAPFLKEKGL